MQLTDRQTDTYARTRAHKHIYISINFSFSSIRFLASIAECNWFTKTVISIRKSSCRDIIKYMSLNLCNFIESMLFLSFFSLSLSLSLLPPLLPFLFLIHVFNSAHFTFSKCVVLIYFFPFKKKKKNKFAFVY